MSGVAKIVGGVNAIPGEFPWQVYNLLKLLFNPLVPGDFFLSIFLTKIGAKVHCMNRLGNLKVQS